MRKLLGAVLVALLIPAAVAAQKPLTSGEEVGRKVPVFTVTRDAAINTAVARVRSDLAAGKLNTWGHGTGGGIRPASVAVAGALFNQTGGKNGTPVYVVTLTAPNAKGRLRVTVDARTGVVAGTPVMDTCKPC